MGKRKSDGPIPRPAKRTKYTKKTYRKRLYTAVAKKDLFGPFEKSKKTFLKYADIRVIDAGVNTVSKWIYRANDLYDPDYQFGGHQPYGFDQLMTLYDHFTVISAKITVEAFNNNGVPVSLFCYTADNALTPDESITTLMERPGVSTVLLADNDAGPSVGRVEQYFSARDFFRKKYIVGDALFRGDASTSPTEQAFFYVGIAPNSLTDDPSGVTCRVLIEYQAVFTEPRLQVQS
uniref:hypothetical protein n=1 Tax=Orrella sp. TaxID=1921583 RepID=UPI004048935F